MDTKYKQEYTEIAKKIFCYWKDVRMVDQSELRIPEEVLNVDVLQSINEHIKHSKLKVKIEPAADLMSEEDNSLMRELVDSDNLNDYHDHNIK